MGFGYRAKQFIERLHAVVPERDLEAVRGVLSPEEYALFAGMPVGDQQHAICVWRALTWPEECPEALARAALLHDVGKVGGGLNLLVRSACVVLDALAHPTLRRLAADDPGSRRYPFHVYLAHGALGAELCRQADSPKEVVALVHYHDAVDPPEMNATLREMLAALQRADAQC